MIKNRVWVYSVTYNEQHFVKNFLAGYRDAERIVVYDNYSTDDTIKLLREDPRVEVRMLNSKDQLRDDLHIDIKNHAWKEARGRAEWVITVDFDEIFNRCVMEGDNPKFDLDLTNVAKLGYNIIRPFGYNMIAMNAPLGAEGHPYQYANRALYHVPEEKMICFNPNEIGEMRFYSGAHECAPLDMEQGIQNIRVCISEEFKMLHFKLWNYEYYLDRIKVLQSRMSEFNRGMGLAWHYDMGDEYNKEFFLHSWELSKPLFEVKRPFNDGKVYSNVRT